MLYQIEVTTHCNFQCFYCAGRDMEQKHMAWTLFERILAGIPAGEHVVSLQGEGEPTTHPKFWQMVETVHARGLTPTTITNGSQIDVEKFAENFSNIGISIDTLDAREAERIGRYKLNRVLQNVEALAARVDPQRIEIMTVNYGQSLHEVRQWAQQRGFKHVVQPLQPKQDYAQHYATRAPAPVTMPPMPALQDRYTYRCRYLEQPLRRYYDIEGREYPCCFIKDARNHEPIETMRAKLAARSVPAGCVGCREIMTQPARNAGITLTAPTISIITTCKSRLKFLQQSLPRMAAQAGIAPSDMEVIVVDYDCPENTVAWVEATFPQVRRVLVKNAPLFNASRARNLGARVATGQWLCFVDADVLLDEQFVERAKPALQPGAFYVLTKAHSPAQGTAICAREDFVAVGGYDEIMQDYGMEDHDLYLRLEALGRKRLVLPTQNVQVIDHNSRLRTQHFAIKNRLLSEHINAMYVHIKNDLMRQLGTLNLKPALKQTIYDEVRRVFLHAAQMPASAPVRIEVNLPTKSATGLRGLPLQRQWVYTLHLPTPPSATERKN